MRPMATLRVLATILALSAVFPTLAAERADPTEGAPYLDWESDLSQRSRALTEAACVHAGDAAAALGSTLQSLHGDLARAFAQTRADAVRELAPLMHRFADQVRDLARRLEQQPAASDS